jgi:hypothetical protein
MITLTTKNVLFTQLVLGTGAPWCADSIGLQIRFTNKQKKNAQSGFCKRNYDVHFERQTAKTPPSELLAVSNDLEVHKIRNIRWYNRGTRHTF